MQTPEYCIANKQQLDNTPISASLPSNAVVPNLLGNMATAKREAVQSVYNPSYSPHSRNWLAGVA